MPVGFLSLFGVLISQYQEVDSLKCARIFIYHSMW